MNIGIITPAPPGSRQGNRVTALRWARLLRELGHRVQVAQHYHGQPWQVLVALHARKSHRGIKRFRRQRPQAPIVVALTGTDIYGDLPRGNPQARESLQLAHALVVLQPHAREQLPRSSRAKAQVIYQSVQTRLQWQPVRRVFRICVLGHLRRVKDPFRAVRAVAWLQRHAGELQPGCTLPRLEVVLAGRALQAGFAQRAEQLQRRYSWFRWLGELPHHRAMRLLAGSGVLVLSSQLEGGANVVCEAMAVGTPVLSSNIGGTRGLLGQKYPGLFPVGDHRALARLLLRCIAQPAFLHRLHRWCHGRRGLVDPERERRSWAQLLERLFRS